MSDIFYTFTSSALMKYSVTTFITNGGMFKLKLVLYHAKLREREREREREKEREKREVFS